MIVGCFTLDVYCDNLKPEYDPNDIHKWGEFPHVYAGETRGACIKQARNDGWILVGREKHLCPKCSGKKTKTYPEELTENKNE